MQKQWTLVAAERAFRELDLPACHTSNERICASAVHGMAMRRLASEIAATRRLTPGEIAIAGEYGWR